MTTTTQKKKFNIIKCIRENVVMMIALVAAIATCFFVPVDRGV